MDISELLNALSAHVDRYHAMPAFTYARVSHMTPDQQTGVILEPALNLEHTAMAPLYTQPFFVPQGSHYSLVCSSVPRNGDDPYTFRICVRDWIRHNMLLPVADCFVYIN